MNVSEEHVVLDTKLLIKECLAGDDVFETVLREVE